MTNVIIRFRFTSPTPLHKYNKKNEPLEIKVLDYDQITYNDAIGSVFFDLNPLLSWESSQISGWFPIFDTLQGIRGEINISVKIQLFDMNPFKDSSVGIQFFSIDSLSTSSSYKLESVLGFVSALDNVDGKSYRFFNMNKRSRIPLD